MCIIVAKPMGVDFPKTETLEECFVSNHDGAGFMWADGKEVHIRKGFMKWNDFEKAIDKCIPKKMRKETAVIMHFRIATHGKVQPSCCHPFPITDDKAKLRKTSTKSRMGVAHNGVIRGRTTADDWSDTMDFVAHVVTPMMRMNPGFMHNSHALDVLEGACGSKLAIMDNAGDIATVGEFIEDGGVLYSNASYLPMRTRWSSYGSLFEDESYWDYMERHNWDDEAYGSISKLVDFLPFEACKHCPLKEECALWTQQCDTEEMAEEAALYWLEELEDELTDDEFASLVNA